MFAWFLALLALVGLLLFGFAAYEEGESGGQYCAVGVDGTERCGPETVDGAYQLPAAGVVIRSAVTTGPVSPASQEGYAVEIDAAGVATITETVAPPTTAGTPAAIATTVRTVELGVEGLQGLLGALDGCGFFGLPQEDEFAPADVSDDGSIDRIEVTLADGTWSVLGGLLGDSYERTLLSACQTTITYWLDFLPAE